MVASITLTDAQAKKRMRELWPVYAPNWLGSTGRWVRLLPFPVKNGPRQPYLHHPGGALVTNPDGMFGAFGEHHVDLLVIEHCSTLQNFYDKRSRYTTSHDGLLLALPRPWREDWLGTIHGGKGGKQLEFGEIVELSRNSTFKPWEGRPYYHGAPDNESDWKFPVRSVLCCYFLKPKDFIRVRDSGNLIPRHEYISKHGRLGQINHPKFREWLRAALAAKQVY